MMFENGYALLIGVNANQIPGLTLPDVTKDVTACRKVLIHPRRCAYPAGNVTVLMDKNATRQNVLGALAQLQERVQADTTVIIYYSGHGWRDASVDPPDFYLIPYDMQPGNYRSRALRAGDFAEAIEAIQSQRLLVILDCCHAGGMGVKEVPGQFASAAIPPQLILPQQEIVTPATTKSLTNLSVGQGRAVLSSSTGEQSSYLRQDGKMSIFTYHLIEALTGHAQPQAGATEVLVSDVMSHVYRRVPASAQADHGTVQTPDFRVSGNFPVALLLGGKGLVQGEALPDPLAAPGQPPRQVVGTAGGDVVGRDKIVHGDEVHGDKVGGDKVSGDKIQIGNVGSGSTVAVGRGAMATTTSGISGQELNTLFAPLLEAINRVSPGKQEQAKETAAALQAEAAKGDKADDTRLAKLINGLIALVPGAVGAVVNIFASPILSGVAGPVTTFVLDKIRGK